MFALDVLLVGDAPSRPAIREALPDHLIDVATASGFDEAVSHLEGGEPNCVVSDYPLPDRDGIELLSAVRERESELPFVMHTAAGDERVAEAAIDGDVTAYVPRDPETDPEDVAGRVVELARQDHVAETLDADDPAAANLRLAEMTMDEAPVGITVADPSEPDEPLIYVNEAFERMTGYDKHEALGRNCRFLQGEGTDPESVAEVREAIEQNRPVSVELLNYRKDGDPFWNQLDLAPVRNDDGDVTHYLGFQADVTERKEIELRARRQAEQLRADYRTRERLLTRLDGLIRRVTGATVNSTSRTELEERVCKAVIETNDYGAAWIGTRQMTSDRIVADARAGCGTDETIRISPDGESTVNEAMRTGTVSMAETSSLPADSPHHRFAPPEGGVAAIPLRYREAEYGVLVVYAARSRTLDDHEIAVFEALGRVIGTGINALQNQRLLATDEYLELVFSGGSPGPILVELAAEAGCEITYKGAVSRTDGRFVLSALVSGADVETLRDAAEGMSEPPEVNLVAGYDDGCLVEVVPPSASLVRTVLDHNGAVRSLAASADSADVRIELPRTADPSAVVQTLLDQYDGLSLVSQQRRERDRNSRRELAETLRGELTDRQLETIQKAYLSEYFEWPRPVSGEDIADSMGITRSTFHQHLRAAQSKIIGELLEEFQPITRPN
ncbi:bacterio-opsin activator domain-containing protein [Natronomonas sp.]|uniref:bacterio-opsin activator domain-containing protein n=1 Tax=Natronomonas sp. TaxID=2184060 RepID=UPI002607EDF6|nr:bacterio-opsin activator domain-containing protein [Natronomonas sp.]